MRPSWKSTIIAVGGVSAAAGAALGHWAWPRDAHAQGLSSVSTVYVPPDGIVFRTLDGRMLARISRDATGGGAFEVYDSEELVTSRLAAGAPPIPRSGAADCACTPRPQSVMLDDLDPWSIRE